MKKDQDVLNLFLTEPSKHWHFEEILKTAKISRPQAVLWLKKFVSEKLVNRVVNKGKMPYYVSNYDSSEYRVKKKIFALNFLENNGFLNHLMSLSKAETIILFGSFSRWDWYKDSDIDIFIYGESDGFQKDFYRAKIHREIELFVCKDFSELKNFKSGFLKNILEGYLVKGTLNFLEARNAL